MSRIWPNQFGTPLTNPTDLDADDPFMVSQDGFIRAAYPGAVKPIVLYNGHLDAGDFAAVAGGLINGAETTTGWTAVFPTQAISTGSSTVTEGSFHVRAILELDPGKASSFYYTPPGTQAIGGHTLVAFDIRFIAEGPVHYAPDEYEARVADGAAVTAGTINRIALNGAAYDTWITVVLPLYGLTNIASVGIYRTNTTSGTTSDRVDVRIDNVRFLNATKLDGAMNASPSSVAVVPPSYTPDANQVPLYLPAGRGVIDAARGVYSKANTVVWLHDYLAHVVGAETGAIDVSFAINRIIASMTRGQMLCASPGAAYRFDSDIRITGQDIILDFTGATCFLTYKTNTPFATIVSSRNVTVVGGMWLGYYSLSQNGSTLTAVAGTPTVASTTMQLDSLNEEVKLPTHINWARASHFARHLPQQLGLTADSGGPRCYWEFSLSDSANVAGDCVLSVYDDDTNALLTSSALTLTATPSTYRISYTPTNLRQRHRVTVRKATATANSIFVSTATPYGENEYNATYDIASAFLVSFSSYVAFRDMWIEGFGGDAIQISDSSVHHVTARRVTSRACRRQGMSFNQGTDYIIEDCDISEPGRSGMDLEPFAADWFTRRVTLRNLRFYNTVNYALAMANWARNFDYVIDGIDVYETRLGVIFGGFTGGVFKNVRNNSALNYGASLDYDLTGINMMISDVRSKVGIQLHTTTNTYDDGTGVATFTPANNLLDSRSVIAVSGTGVAWVTGYRDSDGVRALNAAIGASLSLLTVTLQTAEPNTTYDVAVNTNWDSGHPYITAKTTAGFTINFPFESPADSSGRVTWRVVR